jgi:hypothetical protein
MVFSSLINNIAKDPKSANILRDVPDESRSMAKQISDSVTSGIDLETSVAIARKNTYGLTEADKERIRLETNALRSEMTNILEDKVDDEFDPSFIPFFGEEPDVNPPLQADFNVAFDKFMILTDGDSEQAATLAFDSIKKVWGATSIGGGKRFMKYSPEVFYSVQGVDDDWMEDQYNADMKSLKIKPKDTILATDFETTNSNNPTWPIMTTDDEGRLTPLFDENGVMLRWQPDFSQTREFTKLRGMPAEKTKKAVELRQRLDTLNKISGLTPMGGDA